MCESLKIWQFLNFARKSESGYRPVGPAIIVIRQKSDAHTYMLYINWLSVLIYHNIIDAIPSVCVHGIKKLK